MNPSLARLRQEFAPLGQPVVVFNKSHSGSRLLVQVLAGQRIFMGAELNQSQDSLALVPILERLVCRYYPDYAPLWGPTAWPLDLESLVATAFRRHLSAYDVGQHRGWGWKLCETTYILPVIDAIFPSARYIHLVRDGRDVAFTDHVAPEQPFWRKVYFNTDRIREWHGFPLNLNAYERASHVFNALHWINSVEVGRSHAAMLRERCLQLRYEDLCGAFPGTVEQLLAFLQLAPQRQALDALAPTVFRTRIGKHRTQPRSKQREVLQLIEPTLLSLGYPIEPHAPGLAARTADLCHRLSDRIHCTLRDAGLAGRA